jgi:hypothetical protein
VRHSWGLPPEVPPPSREDKPRAKFVGQLPVHDRRRSENHPALMAKSGSLNYLIARRQVCRSSVFTGSSEPDRLRKPLMRFPHELEFWTIKAGPDGLSRVSVRVSGQGRHSSWLISSEDAEPDVLTRWAEFHLELAGFIPAWAGLAFLPVSH